LIHIYVNKPDIIHLEITFIVCCEIAGYYLMHLGVFFAGDRFNLQYGEIIRKQKTERDKVRNIKRHSVQNDRDHYLLH